MRYSLRQLLLCFTSIAVWLGAMAEGHYLLSSYGAVCFGLLFGISILIAVKMIGRWTTWSHAERFASLVAIALSLAGGLYLARVGFRHGYHVAYEAQRLQRRCLSDPRYEAIAVTYVGGPSTKHREVRVRGSVPNDAALESLHRMVAAEDEWLVKWEVAVRPDGTQGQRTSR